jgi:hypothetical protein
MRRRAIQIALSLFIYFSTVWIAGRCIDGLAYLTARLGASGLYGAVHQYPFHRALFVGLIAGLIPLQVLAAASGFLKGELPESLKKLELEGMKRWVVVLVSPILLMELMRWLTDWEEMRTRTASVLPGSTSAPNYRAFEGFLTTNCLNVIDVRLDIWPDNFWYRCTIHVLTLSAFFTAVGYSIAPWLRKHILPDIGPEAANEGDAIQSGSEAGATESREEK